MHHFAHRQALRLPLAVAGALLLLAAAGGRLSAVDKWVTMYANEYRPGSVTITRGDTVTFVSDDDVPHDAVGRGWSTPLLNKGDSHAVRFSAVGTYRFTCSIHPAMSGSVIVRAAGGGSGATTPPTDLATSGMGGSSTGGDGIAIVVAAATAAAAFGLVVRRIGRRTLR